MVTTGTCGESTSDASSTTTTFSSNESDDDPGDTTLQLASVVPIASTDVLVVEDAALLHDLLLDTSLSPPYMDTITASNNPNAIKVERPQLDAMRLKHELSTCIEPAPEPVPVEASASAAASSQWLQWDDPREVLDCAELPTSSAIEQRRVKNRDSMRRSRQRQRDALDIMRTTVATLERQYDALCVQAPRVGRTAAAAASHQPQPQQQQATHAYWDAVDVTHRLGAENLFLKAAIQDHATWKLQLHRVVESDALQAPSVILPTALERKEVRVLYGFTTLLSDAAVHDAIAASTHTVERIQRLLVGSYEAQTPRDCLTVFGWNVRRRMAGHEMAFVFTKRFPFASAVEIMETTWAADLELERFKRIKSETQRLDILQHINADTFVLGRDVRFPDARHVFRTVYLRFRMATMSANKTRTYVIGTQSVNEVVIDRPPLLLSSVCVDETLVYADMTLWMEFSDLETSGGCEVRWTGETNYKSDAQAFRSAADTLLGLLRWEALAIAPVRTLCL